MKRLTIEISAKLHKQLKIQAIYEDKTIVNYLRDLIEKDLDNKKSTCL